MHRESTDVRQLFRQEGKLAVTSRNPATGERYLAVFNTSDNREPTKIHVNMQDLEISRRYVVHNLWTGEPVDASGGDFFVELRPHACGLYALKEEQPDERQQP
jgi:hypothetical protein